MHKYPFSVYKKIKINEAIFPPIIQIFYFNFVLRSKISFKKSFALRFFNSNKLHAYTRTNSISNILPCEHSIWLTSIKISLLGNSFLRKHMPGFE